MNFQEKITVGIDVFPSIFRMKSKILGEKSENVEYILNETGSVITLRGKGSGFLEGKNSKESDDPLHVHVRLVYLIFPFTVDIFSILTFRIF